MNSNKRSRLEHLDILLKTHPEGLRRSEIARRMGVHRSTVGRYIMELGEKTMLWEENFKVGINEGQSTSYPVLNLPEELSVILAIEIACKRVDYTNFHLISATRKIALKMKRKHPITGSMMLEIVERIDDLPKNNPIDLEANIEYLAEAMEKRQPLDFQLLSSTQKVRILPEGINITQSGPMGESLRVSGKCYKTGKNCSFLLHRIEILKKPLSEEEMTLCPFDSLDSTKYYLLKLKIFTPSVMDNLSSITDKNFQYLKLKDGNYMVDILVPHQKNIQNELMMLGSDIEIIYPQHVRESIYNRSDPQRDNNNKLSKDNRDSIEFIRKEETYKSSQIQEIHHRVKNQFVSLIALIDLYSKNIDDDSTISIMDELKAKLLSILNVHSMLSKGNPWATLPVNNYLPELILNLISSMETIRKIDLISEIDEIYLPEEQLTDIGLIVTELCINSLKHAFTDRKSGKISIKMNKSGEQIKLHYKDDGKGFGNDHEAELSEGTGLNLINIFTERLPGSIEYFSEHGTEVVITFS